MLARAGTTPTAPSSARRSSTPSPSLDAKKASPEALAGIARGRWGIESVHWVRDTAWDEDANTAYTGNGQAMAALRNLAVSLLYLAGVKEVTRTLQAIARDRNRLLD